MLNTLSSEHDIEPWFSDDELMAILADNESDFNEDEEVGDQSGKIDASFRSLSTAQ